MKLLARRELSEAQVRQRLARKGHDLESVEAAVARLREERAINDERVAEAIAHTALAVRGHGKLRIKRQLEEAGIAAVTARRAIDRVFEDVNDDSLLEASIGKRLRGRNRLKDDAEFRRLYRYLIAQGFESDRVVAALKRRRGRNAPDDGPSE